MGRNEYEQFQRRDGGRGRGARPRLGKASLEDQVRDWAGGQTMVTRTRMARVQSENGQPWRWDSIELPYCSGAEKREIEVRDAIQAFGCRTGWHR